jgi:hypothetical protein
MTKRIHDHNGWYQIKGNPLSKSGVFDYPGRSISPLAVLQYEQANGRGSFDPRKMYKVCRSEEELSSEDCINSFKLLPWINEHAMLGSREMGRTPAEHKGIEGVIGEDVYFDDGILKGNIKVLSENLKELIEIEKDELSCGYKCDYEYSPNVYKGERYDFIQKNIRGNHLALTESGRMGADVAVLDSMAFTFDSKGFKEATKMYDNEKKEGMDEETLDEGFNDTQIEQIKSLLKEIVLNKDEEQGPIDEMGEDEQEVSIEDIQEAALDLAEAAADLPGVSDSEEEEDEKEEEDEQENESNVAMDSLRREVRALKKDLMKQSQAMDSVKAKVSDESSRFRIFAKEINRRNELAKKLESHVGVFDHSEMTAKQVAQYGAKKLGINCAKGHEATALDVYFKALNDHRPVVAMDSKEKSNVSDISKFFKRAK